MAQNDSELRYNFQETPKNKSIQHDELDKILFELTGSKGVNKSHSVVGERRTKAKKAITAYKDKAVEEVLDRMEKRSDGSPCTVRYSDGSVERMRVIPLSAIEDERAKLKEVK